MAWDAKAYLGFGAERTRPAAELLGRVAADAPARVADLGCGPGNSTALLRARWPDAAIDAIDSSPEMLAEARAAKLDATLIEADIARWEPGAPYDVIFSNATLQWLSAHENLLPKLMAFVKPGGVLAFQVPRNFEEPCHTLIRETARSGPWAEKLRGVRDWWNVLSPEAYYGVLESRATAVDIWETRYVQVLEGEDAVLRWMMGTGLRPFAAALEGAEREAFLERYRAAVAEAYPRRASGRTLYPFLRLFAVARR